MSDKDGAQTFFDAGPRHTVLHLLRDGVQTLPARGDRELPDHAIILDPHPLPVPDHEPLRQDAARSIDYISHALINP
jgi:hypothetical protein